MSSPDEDIEDNVTFDYSTCTLSAERSTVRLVSIQAYEPGQTHINVHLSVTSFAHAGKDISYDALSYVWGSMSDLETVICDGRILKVTRNLLDALLWLQQTKPQRLVWIDALCINQADDEEKTQQVRLMSDIYRRAERVHIFLGRNNPEIIRIAFSSIRKLARAGFPDPDGNDGYPSTYTRAEIDAMVPHIDTLLKSHWFTRTWILQEAVLARSAVLACGPYDMLWEMLQRAWAYLIEIWQIQADPMENIELDAAKDTMLMVGSARRALQSATPAEDLHLDLATLLKRTRNSSVSDPRDKVFALLGFAQRKGELVPDYSKSVEEVYTATAVTVLEEAGNLDILSCVDAFHASPLPSWVPDWRLPITSKWGTVLWDFARRDEAGVPYYNACGDVALNISPSVEHSYLAIRGVRIDAISRTLHGRVEQESFLPYITAAHERDMSVWKTYYDQFLSVTRLLALHYNLPAVYSATGEDVAAAYFRTITADLLNTSNRFPSEWLRIAFPDHTDLYTPFDNTDSGKAVATETGYLALVPQQAEVGDQIFVLGGGMFPLVLREQGDGTFRYVGESYVHGAMDGEAMIDVDDIELVEVVLV